MLHQRQRDIERHRDTEDGLARMESGLQVAEQARVRLESRVLAKEKEIGSLENKARLSEFKDFRSRVTSYRHVGKQNGCCDPW